MNESINPKRVYILGAGSSIGHSKGSFPAIADFFLIAEKLGIDSEFERLKEYGTNLYGNNIFKNPTDIEDMYTQLEIDIERKPEPELFEVRSQLLNLIKKILVWLEKNLKNHTGEYNEFIDPGHPLLRNEDTIITFNWDILIDNLLDREKMIEKSMPTRDNKYGNFFESFTVHRKLFRSDQTPAPLHENFSTEKGYYLKMHGSIDWAYCSNQDCENFQEVFPIMDPLSINICRECFEPLETLLVPPLLNKNYRKYPMIRKIWNLAAHEMQAATEIIIWGYSLPPTDFYSKWLLQQGRKAPLNKVILINPDTKKDDFNNKFKNLFKNIPSIIAWEYYESFDHFVQKNHILNPGK